MNCSIGAGAVASTAGEGNAARRGVPLPTAMTTSTTPTSSTTIPSPVKPVAHAFHTHEYLLVRWLCDVEWSASVAPISSSWSSARVRLAAIGIAATSKTQEPQEDSKHATLTAGACRRNGRNWTLTALLSTSVHRSRSSRIRSLTHTYCTWGTRLTPPKCT